MLFYVLLIDVSALEAIYIPFLAKESAKGVAANGHGGLEVLARVLSVSLFAFYVFKL